MSRSCAVFREMKFIRNLEWHGSGGETDGFRQNFPVRFTRTTLTTSRAAATGTVSPNSTGTGTTMRIRSSARPPAGYVSRKHPEKFGMLLYRFLPPTQHAANFLNGFLKLDRLAVANLIQVFCKSHENFCALNKSQTFLNRRNFPFGFLQTSLNDFL